MNIFEILNINIYIYIYIWLSVCYYWNLMNYLTQITAFTIKISLYDIGHKIRAINIIHEFWKWYVFSHVHAVLCITVGSYYSKILYVLVSYLCCMYNEAATWCCRMSVNQHNSQAHSMDNRVEIYSGMKLYDGKEVKRTSLVTFDSGITLSWLQVLILPCCYVFYFLQLWVKYFFIKLANFDIVIFFKRTTFYNMQLPWYTTIQ